MPKEGISAKRKTLLATTAPSDPYTKLMGMCDRAGEKAYKLPANGFGKGLVDVEGVELVCDILRPMLHEAEATVEVLDTAIREIDSIRSAAATCGGLQDWMERLRVYVHVRVWEQEQSACPP